MDKVQIEVERWVLDVFRKEAKRLFPREAYAILIGHQVGNLYAVDDIWIPDDLEKHVTTHSVDIQPYWEIQAHCEAEEDDAAVLGSIHSHPFNFDKCGGEFYGKAAAAPSVGDWQVGWPGIAGICAIAEQSDGRLKTRTRFYGPATPAETRVA
jgi:hypothetical protein